VKQWRIQAERAYLYQTEGIVHAREVKSEIYDANGQITHVVSREAKYFMQSRDLELFGDVKTTFPTGLETTSPYMHYSATTRDILVPVAYPVEGRSIPPSDPELAKSKNPNERMEFRSKGMRYSGTNDVAHLLSDVHVRVINEKPTGTEVTTIESDRAEIDRRKNIGKFTMLEARPADQRFVKIAQPGMNSRSRRAEFRLNANPKRVRTMLAIDDVKIEEKPTQPSDSGRNARRRAPVTRYATAGLAEFDSEKNLIVLRDYPQVYQDRDTITGETIIVHRDSDLVEVDQSNAFTEAQEEEE
jgi:lipopolysaccharide export system protein LptA